MPRSGLGAGLASTGRGANPAVANTAPAPAAPGRRSYYSTPGSRVQDLVTPQAPGSASPPASRGGLRLDPPVDAAEPQVAERRSGGLRIYSDSDVTSAVRPTVDYSDQQNTVIHCPSNIIVVNAFAGTGKTTTAIGYADARPNERFLYIAFNKGIQEEAARRFGRNVTCRTSHSLAYAAVGRFYQNRIARPWRALVLKNEAGLMTVREAALAQSILSSYFHSCDDQISVAHGAEAIEQFRAEDHEIHDAAAHARRIWERMKDQRDSISIPDDAYLKMWALSKPRLKYDHIIFDECQDANPVTSQIVGSQTHAKLLYIGDRYQSIYAFRGAHSAMDDFPQAKHLQLTQTWRFGPRIATLANLLLNELLGEPAQIQGMAEDGRFVKGSCITKLSRTNAQLFKDAALRMGEGIHWVGGSKNYQLNRLIEAHNLFAGRRDQITDPFLRHFGSWAEMQSYAEEAKDPETKILAEVIDEFRGDTPMLVNRIKENEVQNAKDAQLILTTAHRAKGLDWDYVQIADDFETLAETEADLAVDPNAPLNTQELNLLYVGFTRAKKKLQLNEESIGWLERLPEHRAARERARNKQARSLAEMRAAI